MTCLRPISVESRSMPSAPRVRPELRWVPIEQLVVDDRYQRDLNKGDWANIRTIADNFDWARFTACLVSPIDGGTRFALIDGQHRSHGALMAGESEVPCLIVDLSVQQQASAFSWVNGNVTAITTFHVYKAALAAEEDWAIQSRDAVNSAGAKLMVYQKSAQDKKPGEIFAIKLIRAYVDKGRPEVVRDGIGALIASRQAGDVRLYTDGILRPWLAAIADRPGLVRKDFIGFLECFDLWKVQVEVWKKKQSHEFSHLSNLEMMKSGLEQRFAQHFSGSR